MKKPKNNEQSGKRWNMFNYLNSLTPNLREKTSVMLFGKSYKELRKDGRS
ncbi:MAG: hypothetical protein RQ866_05100 [Bacteroidales bacterium]|nr:hypothetical protein [Bacteroidales bacterium]